MLKCGHCVRKQVDTITHRTFCIGCHREICWNCIINISLSGSLGCDESDERQTRRARERR